MGNPFSTKTYLALALGLLFATLSIVVVVLVNIGIKRLALTDAEQERESLRSRLFQAQKMETAVTLTGGVAHDFNNLRALAGDSWAFGRE